MSGLTSTATSSETGKRLARLLFAPDHVHNPDVLPCARCGKVISIEADEGSMREEGVFCNKHLPEETEE